MPPVPAVPEVPPPPPPPAKFASAVLASVSAEAIAVENPLFVQLVPAPPFPAITCEVDAFPPPPPAPPPPPPIQYVEPFV